jgi:hypothetical protein
MAIPKTLRTALWIVGTPVVLIATYWVVFMSPLPFSASWWDVDAEQGTFLKSRYRIADQLAASGRLLDMTRDEVIGLLGAPVTDVDRLGKHGLIYVLGPERGLVRIDYEWLLIDFDLNGRVSNVEVTTD